MVDLSLYGGIVGATVRGFARLSTLFTLIPVFVAIAIAGFLVSYFASSADLPFSFTALLLLVAVAPITGTFGLKAAQGQLDAGFFGGSTRGPLSAFLVRYAVLIAAWGIPLAVLTNLGAAGMFESGLPSLSDGFRGLAFLLILVFAVILQFASLLVALRSTSVAECFDPEQLSWLSGRRDEFVSLMAGLVGGLAVFCLIAIPFMGLLTALAFAIKPGLGIVLAGATYVVPSLSTPVLLGRLAGGMIYADELPSGAGAESLGLTVPRARSPEEARLAAAIVPTVAATAPKTPSAAASSLEAAPPTDAATIRAKLSGGASTASPMLDPTVRIINEIRALSGSDPDRALSLARGLVEDHPLHSGAKAELAKLTLSSGAQAEAIPVAIDAIKSAFRSGANPIALDVYKKFRSLRKHLVLDGDEYLRLGRGLIDREAWLDALWCFRAAQARGAQRAAVEKAIIAAADGAAKAGSQNEARQIYEFFEQAFSDSPFLDYVASALQRLR